MTVQWTVENGDSPEQLPMEIGDIQYCLLAQLE